MATRVRKETKSARRRFTLGPGRVSAIGGDPRSDPKEAEKRGITGAGAPQGLYTLEDLARAGQAYIPGVDRAPSPQKGPMGLPPGLVSGLQTIAVGSAGLGGFPVPTKNTGLVPAPPRPGIPEAVGVGKATPASSPTGSGGVASPLVEGLIASPATLQRTYHGLQVVPAVDGLFTFEYKAVATLKMVDANGAQVQFNFSDDPPV